MRHWLFPFCESKASITLDINFCLPCTNSKNIKCFLCVKWHSRSGDRARKKRDTNLLTGGSRQQRVNLTNPLDDAIK